MGKHVLKRFLTAPLLLVLVGTMPCNAQQVQPPNDSTAISLEVAEHLAALPMACLDKEFPYRPWYVMVDSSYTGRPRTLHPAFYGCYDWHSCVHGHWLLVALLKQFPNMKEAERMQQKLSEHLTLENIEQECAIFKGPNSTFERIYGWAWVLQLQNELLTWQTPLGQNLAKNVQPLASLLSGIWVSSLQKLHYPIREPEHYNLAFGLCLTWDYAITANDTTLQAAIREAAYRFYANDVDCPVAYEPGGYDFLSPCLEEADLMRRVMQQDEFVNWLGKFMPTLLTSPATLYPPAKVNDPSDGKLVHLYGVNFSRAWCLNGIAENLPDTLAAPIRATAMENIRYSLPHVASEHYAGTHWLATYAFYALRGVKANR